MCNISKFRRLKNAEDIRTKAKRFRIFLGSDIKEIFYRTITHLYILNFTIVGNCLFKKKDSNLPCFGEVRPQRHDPLGNLLFIF